MPFCGREEKELINFVCLFVVAFLNILLNGILKSVNIWNKCLYKQVQCVTAWHLGTAYFVCDCFSSSFFCLAEAEICCTHIYRYVDLSIFGVPTCMHMSLAVLCFCLPSFLSPSACILTCFHMYETQICSSAELALIKVSIQCFLFYSAVNCDLSEICLI